MKPMFIFQKKNSFSIVTMKDKNRKKIFIVLLEENGKQKTHRKLAYTKKISKVIITKII